MTRKEIRTMHRIAMRNEREYATTKALCWSFASFLGGIVFCFLMFFPV